MLADDKIYVEHDYENYCNMYHISNSIYHKYDARNHKILISRAMS